MHPRTVITFTTIAFLLSAIQTSTACDQLSPLALTILGPIYAFCVVFTMSSCPRTLKIWSSIAPGLTLQEKLPPEFYPPTKVAFSKTTRPYVEPLDRLLLWLNIVAGAYTILAAAFCTLILFLALSSPARRVFRISYQRQVKPHLTPVLRRELPADNQKVVQTHPITFKFSEASTPLVDAPIAIAETVSATPPTNGFKHYRKNDYHGAHTPIKNKIASGTTPTILANNEFDVAHREDYRDTPKEIQTSAALVCDVPSISALETTNLSKANIKQVDRIPCAIPPDEIAVLATVRAIPSTECNIAHREEPHNTPLAEVKISAAPAGNRAPCIPALEFMNVETKQVGCVPVQQIRKAYTRPSSCR